MRRTGEIPTSPVPRIDKKAKILVPTPSAYGPEPDCPVFGGSVAIAAFRLTTLIVAAPRHEQSIEKPTLSDASKLADPEPNRLLPAEQVQVSKNAAAMEDGTVGMPS